MAGLRRVTHSVVIGHSRYALTPWFAATAAPAYVGVYERESAGVGEAYACWDGQDWRRDADTAHAAAELEKSATRMPRRWRGLTESTAAACATCGGHTVIDAGVDDERNADMISECPDC